MNVIQRGDPDALQTAIRQVFPDIRAETDLDTLIYGAANIARAANILDENGEPDIDRTYYHLHRGDLSAGKMNGIWVTTKRRLLEMTRQRPRPNSIHRRRIPP
jgi:hypothetical protein